MTPTYATGEPVAVVDLGTNSCLMLVGARNLAGTYDVLHDVCEVPRMGEGLDRTGNVSADALARIEQVLAGYLQIARGLGVDSIQVGGTAALRRARNQAQVLDALARPGITVEVLSEEREARMGWLAAHSIAPELAGVIDVGGGSTEVAAAGGTRWSSAPVGATVLTERVGEEGFLAMVAAARTEMERAYPALVGVDSHGTWVSLGGTPCNLASLVLGLPVFDHTRVEGVICTLDEAKKWGAELAERNLNDRCQLPIEASRAPVLHGGLAALVAAMEFLGVVRLHATGRGLRFGYLAESLGLG